MVFKEDGGQYTIPNYKMDYYRYQKEPTYLDRSCSFQMNVYKYSPEKMTKRSPPHCKEPVESFDEYSSLLSSKTYSRISNSILSYVVGGFVGSKSQMNNNKHNLSYDLSAVIFNLLNPCKYEREKASSRKSNEINFYSAASKINPESYEKYIVGRSSQKCEQVNDRGMDIMELKCLMLPFEDLVEPNHFILDFDKQCNYNSKSMAKNYSNNSEEGNCGDLHSCDDSDDSRKLNSNVGDDEIIPCDTTDHVLTHKKIENLESIGGSMNESEREHSKIINHTSGSLWVNTKVKPTDTNLADSPTIIISLPCDDSNKMKDMATDSMCQIPVTSKTPDTFRNSIHSLAIQRFRQQSECSIESTDSESFIVFDDGDDDDFKKEEIRMKIEKVDFDSDDDDDEDEDDDEDDDEDEDEDDEDDDDDDDEGDVDVDVDVDDDDEEEEKDDAGNDSDNEGDSSGYDYDVCSCDKEILEANDKWAKNYKDVVLIDDEKNKKVRFNDNVKVNTIIAWDYAYRAARTGPWEQMARDQDRFKERIWRLSSIISPVLEREHRDKIYKELYS